MRQWLGRKWWWRTRWVFLSVGMLVVTGHAWAIWLLVAMVHWDNMRDTRDGRLP